MATIFQSPIRRKNPTTGKMENAFDAKGKQIFHPKWRTIIVDHKGMRKTFTLSTNKQQSQKQADSLETREREIKNGLRAVPEAPDVNAVRPIEEALLEYLAWGKAQGGKKGAPWDPEHAFKKERHLQFWTQALGLESLGDLYGILPKVEAECRKLLANGNGGKTVTHKAMNLRSFILWCRKRKYLTEDPLEELGKFDTAPKSIRRAMAMEEFQTLLEKCAPHRRLLYEVGTCPAIPTLTRPIKNRRRYSVDGDFLGI